MSISSVLDRFVIGNGFGSLLLNAIHEADHQFNRETGVILVPVENDLLWYVKSHVSMRFCRRMVRRHLMLRGGLSLLRAALSPARYQERIREQPDVEHGE